MSLQRSQPWWVTQEQEWAEDHVAASHADALYSFGEWAVFTLFWTSNDFERGLVGRCPRCILGDRLSAGYGDTDSSSCPACFGTTYAGGIRAQIVRPALVTDDAPQTEETRRGEVTRESVAVQTTSDFLFRAGDMMFRADGSRYQLSDGTIQVIRSGFGHPDRERSVGMTTGRAAKESETAPAFAIPPDEITLKDALRSASTSDHLVLGLTRYDKVRGYLVPDDA